jgi:ethanolamine permease
MVEIYNKVSIDMSERNLQKKANWFSLTAVGVGAVVSGNFFGWQFGLLAGGFLGMLIATLIIAVLYICLLSSVAEMSTMHPSAGGFYTFTEIAFGRFVGFICGVCICIEYILVPAVVISGVGGYLQALLPHVPVFLWWIAAYIIFLSINITGVSVTLKFSCVITILSVLVLFFFYFSSIFSGSFHWASLFSIHPAVGHNSIFPRGIWGIWFALPLAIWLFIGVEEMPMAAEETKDVTQNMPKALAISIITLTILAILTVVINSGTGKGANSVGHSDAPLMLGFLSIYGHSIAAKIIFTLLALIGLVASVHNLVYAFGRILFALGRDRALPRYLGVLNRFDAPASALITGGVIGLLAMFIMQYVSASFIGAVLLNMAVFAALLSYILVLMSYVKLKRNESKQKKVIWSIVGTPGAIVGIVLAILSVIATLHEPSVRPGIYGLIVVLILAAIYFKGIKLK